jgi:hypothetical protein
MASKVVSRKSIFFFQTLPLGVATALSPHPKDNLQFVEFSKYRRPVSIFWSYTFLNSTVEIFSVPAVRVILRLEPMVSHINYL